LIKYLFLSPTGNEYKEVTRQEKFELFCGYEDVNADKSSQNTWYILEKLGKKDVYKLYYYTNAEDKTVRPITLDADDIVLVFDIEEDENPYFVEKEISEYKIDKNGEKKLKKEILIYELHLPKEDANA